MGLQKVVWTKKGNNDLDSIFNFIFLDSEKHAFLFINEIKREVDNLIYFPKKGRKISESNKNYREIFIGNYRVLYFLIDEEIIILRVIHMSLDYNLRIENNI